MTFSLLIKLGILWVALGTLVLLVWIAGSVIYEIWNTRKGKEKK